jgi:hypothetical protein
VDRDRRSLEGAERRYPRLTCLEAVAVFEALWRQARLLILRTVAHDDAAFLLSDAGNVRREVGESAVGQEGVPRTASCGLRCPPGDLSIGNAAGYA